MLPSQLSELGMRLRYTWACWGLCCMPQHVRCLQDAQVTQEQQQSFYTQLVLLLREMYQRCHLVHADLSEYNILVHEVSISETHSCGKLWL